MPRYLFPLGHPKPRIRRYRTSLDSTELWEAASYGVDQTWRAIARTPKQAYEDLLDFKASLTKRTANS